MSEKKEFVPFAIHAEEYYHNDEEGNKMPRCWWIDVSTPTGTSGTIHVENDAELVGLALAVRELCKTKGIWPDTNTDTDLLNTKVGMS